MSLEMIIHETKAYWTRRTQGYSRVNQSELSTSSRRVWQDQLQRRIFAEFPGKTPEDLRVLEVGTGPGFFAIVLSESGFHVTAVDLTPSMLDEARKNAGTLAGEILFLEMNAESLSFADNSFDIVVSRNLTWNLPHPEKAYREWERVLAPGGLLLNYDANWYRYLYDEAALARYEKDRHNSALQGIRDENVGEGFDVMEDIARRVPLSRIQRPKWDRHVLAGLGLEVTSDECVWEQVWTAEEKINFASTPMFLVKAVKKSSKKSPG